MFKQMFKQKKKGNFEIDGSSTLQKQDYVYRDVASYIIVVVRGLYNSNYVSNSKSIFKIY